MQWNLLYQNSITSIEQLQRVLLTNRGITDPERFFNPAHPSTLTPEAVGIDPEQLDVAIVRLQLAKERGEQVLVFGDYDADGICSTAIMWQALHAFGVSARPCIPHRERHGYGLSLAAVEEASENFKPDLIVTVDNGIVAFPVLEELQRRGISVIVSDHHQPEKTASGEDHLPPAEAVVHTTQLCGTTVAWMLATALLPERKQDWLDFCAIATVADLVSLTNANRSFVFHGLSTLRNTSSIGLRALCETAGIELAGITCQTIGYSIGPRINAMGRLAHGLDALRLLCTNNPDKARELATVLCQTNGKRQDLTEELFEVALAQIEGRENDPVLIVHSREFHEGVVGLIAGRLTEKFHKPAIAISLGESVGKASARSVPGVNIVELIREVRDDLLEVGGHPMAAGFGLHVQKLERVVERLRAVARAQVLPEHLEKSLDVDAELPLELVTEELVEMINQFEPFGKDNERPLFLIRDAQVVEVAQIGKEGRHVKLTIACSRNLKDQNRKLINVLHWNGCLHYSIYRQFSQFSVVGELEVNRWKNKVSVQLMLKDSNLRL